MQVSQHWSIQKNHSHFGNSKKEKIYGKLKSVITKYITGFFILPESFSQNNAKFLWSMLLGSSNAYGQILIWLNKIQNDFLSFGRFGFYFSHLYTRIKSLVGLCRNFLHFLKVQKSLAFTVECWNCIVDQGLECMRERKNIYCDF